MRFDVEVEVEEGVAVEVEVEVEVGVEVEVEVEVEVGVEVEVEVEVFVERPSANHARAFTCMWHRAAASHCTWVCKFCP